jgi:hypothetical protein
MLIAFDNDDIDSVEICGKEITEVYIKEDAVKKVIKDEYLLEDVFPEADLKQWALNNGFTEDES